MTNSNPISAYDNIAKITEQGNITDAVVLEKAAWMLENLKKDVNTEEWITGLKHNNLIWTVIQGEMIDKAKHLPDGIKANIVSLSIFVDKRTLQCLHDKERKAQDLDVLININRNIALGLRGNAGTGVNELLLTQKEK